MARDFIAMSTDIAPSDISLAIDRQLPITVSRHLERATQLRTTAEQARKQAAEEWRAAALELRASGMTVRHIGDALGISHQRAQQLIKG
jgi:DNA-binding NarL/FixJ family response regulator